MILYIYIFLNINNYNYYYKKHNYLINIKKKYFIL